MLEHELNSSIAVGEKTLLLESIINNHIELAENPLLQKGQFRLSEAGRLTAKSIYKEVEEGFVGLADLETAICSLRAKLNRDSDIRNIRRRERYALAKVWKEQGRDKKADELAFKSELRSRLGSNQVVVDVELTRRFLSSLTQQAQHHPGVELSHPERSEGSPDLFGIPPKRCQSRSFWQGIKKNPAYVALVSLAIWGLSYYYSFRPQLATIPDTFQPPVAHAATFNLPSVPEEVLVPIAIQETAVMDLTPTLVEGKRHQPLVPRNPYLGMRNDIPKLMDMVSNLGAFQVRIDGGLSETNGDTLKDESVKEAVQKAKENNLSILYLFNPQQLLSREEIHKRLEVILAQGGDITLELGNEPDDVNVPFWKGRDLKSYARFIKVASEEAEKIKPGTKVVVGALVERKNFPKLVAYLKQEQVSPNNLTFAIHAYHTPGELSAWIDTVQLEVSQPKLMVTEAGINVSQFNPQADANLLEMARMAQRLQIPFFIHQLGRTEVDPVTGEIFGFVNPQTRQAVHDFYLLQAGLSQLSP